MSHERSDLSYGDMSPIFFHYNFESIKIFLIFLKKRTWGHSGKMEASPGSSEEVKKFLFIPFKLK